ncbi:Peptidase family M50 [uncultured archaeon]|nr:Peptidase family M50 [uncultured archaeon]
MLFPGVSYFSRVGSTERIDLLLSWAVLVIGFSLAVGGRRVPSIDLIMISALGVGTGFLLHELAHKFIAQRYGYWAEYRANRNGLLIIIIMSLMGFILAAPGAVMIHKVSNPYPESTAYSDGKEAYDQSKARKEQLWISLAGPMTNIALTALFLVLLVSGIMTSMVSVNAIYFAFFINLYLAAFNLIPFGPLDGRKIFEANRLAWAIVAVPTILIALSVLVGRGIF